MHVWGSQSFTFTWNMGWEFLLCSALHLIYKGPTISPIKYRRLSRVLSPVSRPVTALNCVLLKDRSLVFAVGLGPKINFWASLWVPTRPRHIIIWWLSIQHFIFRTQDVSEIFICSYKYHSKFHLHILLYMYFIISHANLQNIRLSYHYICLHLFYTEQFTHYFCFYHTMYSISSSESYA